MLTLGDCCDEERGKIGGEIFVLAKYSHLSLMTFCAMGHYSILYLLTKKVGVYIYDPGRMPAGTLGEEHKVQYCAGSTRFLTRETGQTVRNPAFFWKTQEEFQATSRQKASVSGC